MQSLALLTEERNHREWTQFRFVELYDTCHMTLASLPRKGKRIKKAVTESRTAHGLDHVETEEV